LKDGFKDPRVKNQSRFYYHLGEAYQRLGREQDAAQIYKEGAKMGLYPSALQRSLYNAPSSAHLRAQPWWKIKDTGYEKSVVLLQKHWKAIRDEGLKLLDDRGSFVDEAENLRDYGMWKQLTLWAAGQEKPGCRKAPKTCDIIRQIPEAIQNKRGQIKYSVLHPDTHVWPHTGPTNVRLRMHLGLRCPDGPRIRVGNAKPREWKEGKVFILDDSFEHEVWHEGKEVRLILIVDVWHPDLTPAEKQQISPM